MVALLQSVEEKNEVAAAPPPVVDRFQVHVQHIP